MRRAFLVVSMGRNGEAGEADLGLALLSFSHLAKSNSLRPLGLQHTRLPCPSPSPGACSNSCPLSQ